MAFFPSKEPEKKNLEKRKRRTYVKMELLWHKGLETASATAALMMAA